MNTVTRIKLTAAQRSALECAGLDDEDGAALMAAWDGGSVLEVAAGEADRLADELTDAANSEDGTAETTDDSEIRKQARRACTALTVLATKVRRAKGH